MNWISKLFSPKTTVQVAFDSEFPMQVIDQRCGHCKKKNSKYKCGKCQKQFYCSRDCQAQDWINRHRSTCIEKKEK